MSASRSLELGRDRTKGIAYNLPDGMSKVKKLMLIELIKLYKMCAVVTRETFLLHLWS